MGHGEENMGHGEGVECHGEFRNVETSMKRSVSEIRGRKMGHGIWVTGSRRGERSTFMSRGVVKCMGRIAMRPVTSIHVLL